MREENECACEFIKIDCYNWREILEANGVDESKPDAIFRGYNCYIINGKCYFCEQNKSKIFSGEE